MEARGHAAAASEEQQQQEAGPDRLKRVAQILEDTFSDDDSEAAQRTKPKPGAITPLGVRVDRGQGLLSVSGASATLAEMDAAISSIKAWQQRHEHDVADMMRRHEAVFSAAMAAHVRDQDAENGNAEHDEVLSSQPEASISDDGAESGADPDAGPLVSPCATACTESLSWCRCS